MSKMPKPKLMTNQQLIMEALSLYVEDYASNKLHDINRCGRSDYDDYLDSLFSHLVGN